MTPPPATRLAAAPEVLARCRDLVRPALAQAVRRLHPWHAEMAAFSLGWATADGSPAPGSQGKGIRQTLTLLSAEAMRRTGGGRGRRRGRRGTDPCLLAPPRRHHGRRRDPQTACHRVEGVRNRPGDPRRRRTLRAGRADPGRLPRKAQRGGGPSSRPDADRPGTRSGRRPALRVPAVDRAGGGPAARVPVDGRAQDRCAARLRGRSGRGARGCPGHYRRRARPGGGRHLGVGFQAVDDLLGIWGDPEVTGKPVHSDLRRLRRRRTPSSRPWPRTVPPPGGSPHCSAPETRSTAPAPGGQPNSSRKPHGRSATLTEAHQQLDSARRSLETVPLAPAALDEILALLPFLIDRTG